MLIASILAFVRVFVLGVAAVSLGMSDRGGVSSALLRVFQLYNLFFVYILFLQYAKPESRALLKAPSIVLASVSPILSVLALIEFIRGAGASFPVDLAQTGGSILIVILLDILILGLLALDALKSQSSRGDAGSAPPAADQGRASDAQHEVH